MSGGYLPRALALVAALVCLGAPIVEAATRYDPRLRFRTISTPRFDIHFHQGEDAVARRLAGFIEQAAADVDRAVGAAFGRVQVILVDQHDLANGWATPLPYNTIEISIVTPAAASSVGNTDDWLRLVFLHEYTHIAHLSRAQGWIGGLRRGLGRMPLLFPNLYQPAWGIEGIATWRETASTGQGRVAAGDFRQLIERAAAAEHFEPIDRTNGGNVDWPSGATPYVYGAYFHEYLSRRYGSDSIRMLADETSRRLPYLGSRAYNKVFGRSLGQLWKDFEAATTGRSKMLREERLEAIRLTRHGFTVSGPRHAPDGRVFYSAASPHHFPALMEIRRDATPRRVTHRYLGNSIGIAGNSLVVDEVDLVRAVGLQSDLYLVNPADGSRQRLTHQARASDPDVSRSGVVVCTLQLSGRRAVATFALPQGGGPAAPDILISEESTDFASPRWSADSRLIAAERRQLGGRSHIVLIDPANRSVKVLVDLPGGRSASPTWTPDGRRVLFSSAIGEEPFRIFAVDVETGAIARLEGTGAAQWPDVSADGNAVVYVGYTADGYDLFSLPLDGARWTRWTPAVDGPVRELPTSVSTDQPVGEPQTYSPWRTLRPQFWTPTIESDAGEVVVGAATGSADALGRHAYGLEAGWASRRRPDWQIAYAYDRWRPTLFASVADDTDPWRSGAVRTREADLGILWRQARVRFSHTTFAAFHVARDAFECDRCVPVVAAALTRASLRLGWDVSNARAFGYSIGNEEGQRLAVTAESTRTAFGADGNGFASTADARLYRRVGPRHAVVALRGAAAASWGDDEAERLFSASGAGPQLAGFGFGTDAIGLLRGFDADDVVGTRAVAFNADFRLPLGRIDRGVGTLPFFLRNVHAALFFDLGHAWNGAYRWGDVRTATGLELSADTVVGYGLPLTFTLGGAWRRDGDIDRSVVAFARVGRAF